MARGLGQIFGRTFRYEIIATSVTNSTTEHYKPTVKLEKTLLIVATNTLS